MPNRPVSTPQTGQPPTARRTVTTPAGPPPCRREAEWSAPVVLRIFLALVSAGCGCGNSSSPPDPTRSGCVYSRDYACYRCAGGVYGKDYQVGCYERDQCVTFCGPLAPGHARCTGLRLRLDAGALRIVPAGPASTRQQLIGRCRCRRARTPRRWRDSGGTPWRDRRRSPRALRRGVRKHTEAANGTGASGASGFRYPGPHDRAEVALGGPRQLHRVARQPS